MDYSTIRCKDTNEFETEVQRSYYAIFVKGQFPRAFSAFVKVSKRGGGGSCRVFITRHRGTIRSAEGTRAGAGAKGRLRGGSCGGRSHQSAPGARPRSPDAHRRAAERALKHTLKNPEKNRGVTFSRILIYLSYDRCRVYFWLEVHAISYRRHALIKNRGGSRREGEPEGAGRRGAPAGEQNRQTPQRR